MRTVISLNRKWAFTKEHQELPTELPKLWNFVNLPHTWNNIDGQDGGGDYYRGTCCYARELNREDMPAADRYYLEFNGANSSADLYVNGEKLSHHDGGYSTWRCDITEALANRQTNLIVVTVDNAPNKTVYPQTADFTFYGGLYRDVNLIALPESHFDLDYYGGPGIMVTPILSGSQAKVDVRTFCTNKSPAQKVRITLSDAEGNTVASALTDGNEEFLVENAHKWNGKKDPYLYTSTAELLDGEKILDQVSARFGCRSFHVDPEEGFFLNDEPYPLRGVSRHQDRWAIGNALLPEHHKEDMDLICEVGATTVRLAHYQHDQYFYDLCDEKGLIVWAEIPYISEHIPEANENSISQMKELIIQSYNHPSIVVWGLSNEISMQGSSEDLLKNHRFLNDMVHEMDPNRLTAVAVLSMCDIHDPYIQIPDVVSYNHYFGWYGGDTSINGPWLDKFHAEFPDIPIGLSEYGCEAAMNWHSSAPAQGDYTEEYQAYYHEELIKQLFTRPYLWATHVWNMFDFGADNRSEGGENGQNHKGLVTFDRTYKKDAFYAYKAWLSEDPFVHICGKRYIDRVEDLTKVTVYSNQPEVELFVNGKSLGKQESKEHFFYFQVPNAGESRLLAVAGSCRDESVIRKVEQFNEAYRLKEKGAILNWFDITAPEGFFSLNDKAGEVMAVPEGLAIVMELLAPMAAQAKADTDQQKAGMNESIMQMLSGFTILRMASMLGMMNVEVTKEQLLDLNARLNQIKKP